MSLQKPDMLSDGLNPPLTEQQALIDEVRRLRTKNVRLEQSLHESASINEELAEENARLRRELELNGITP